MTDCFLSIEAGFLPVEPPLTRLPAGHEAWDELASHLPQCVAELSVEKAICSLPSLSAPTAGLSRAATLLGIFVHALVREQQLLQRPVAIPESLQQP